MLGRETRPHKDLDILVRLDDIALARELLERDGYSLKELWSENLRTTDSRGVETDSGFVLEDLAGRQIDLHAICLRPDGSAVPAYDGEGMTFSAEDLSGAGTIAGLPVHCLSVEMQFRGHTGYGLPERQIPDLHLLRELADRTSHAGESWRQHTARNYCVSENLCQMYALLTEARSQTNDWRYWHVGELAFGFFMIDCHLDPKGHVRLWHAGDKLIGYALLGDDAYFDWQVFPEVEGKGIEEEALAWGTELLAELRAGDAERWKGPMMVGTRVDNAQRVAFLEQSGFRRGEYVEVNMLRSLDAPIGEQVLPPGYVVRSVVDDSREVSRRAEAQRDVWRPWTVGDVTDEQYARFMRMPGYDRDLDVVAVAPDGTIAAYVNGWLDPVNRIGDLGPVGAREAYRRKGLTRAVLLECMRRMKARGMDRVCVSTGEGNVAARGLYESVGFRVVNRYVEYARE